MGRAVIVFDRVAWAENFRILKGRDGSDEGILNLVGETGRDAVDIDLPSVATLRFQKDLVACLIGELDYLVLNGGAVTRSHPIDHPSVEGRLVKV